MRHRTRAAVALVLALSLAAACGGPGKEAGGSNSASVSSDNLPDCPLDALKAATGKVKVTLWYGGLQGKTLDTMKAQITAFNQSQNKVEVVGQDEGQSYDEVQQKYKGAIRSKQLPSIVYLENTSLQAMIDSGTAIPAAACMKADGYDQSQIEDTIRTYYSVNDVLWPGYFNVSEPVLYYNKAAFKKAGLDPDKPPANLQELRDASVKLKAVGYEAPLALSLKRWFVESWLEGAGVDVVNNGDGHDGLADKSDIDNPKTKEILDWIKQMNADGLLLPVSNTAGNINQYTALTGKSAMTIETSAAATTIAAFLKGDINGNDLGAGDIKVDPTQVAAADAPYPGLTEPGKVSVGGGAFFLVDPKANGQDPATLAGAYEFLKFQLQKEQVVAWHLGSGYLPVLKGADQDPRIQEFWNTDVAGQMLKVAAGQLASIDPKRNGPLIGPYNDYGLALQKMLEDVAFKGTDPAKAAATAQTEIDKALEQYKQDNG